MYSWLRQNEECDNSEKKQLLVRGFIVILVVLHSLNMSFQCPEVLYACSTVSKTSHSKSGLLCTYTESLILEIWGGFITCLIKPIKTE